MLPILEHHPECFLLYNTWKAYKEQWFQQGKYPNEWALDVQNKLQTIEDQLAKAAGRPPATVQFDYDDITEDDEAAEIDTAAWYDRKHNIIRIAGHVETTGLELLYSLYHEDEHANQAYGCGYTPAQKYMGDIHHAFYDEERLAYANNYLEVYARQKELLAIQKIYQEIATHPNATDFDKKECLHVVDILSLRLNHTVTLPNQLALNQKHMKLCGDLRYCTDKWKHTFPGSIVMTRIKAWNFLRQHTKELCEQLVSESSNTDRNVRDWRDNIEAQEKQQQRDVFLQNQRQRILDYAQTHGVPTITGPTIAEFPSYCMPIVTKEEFEPFIQEAMNQYNAAVWIHPYYDICVIADREPIQRIWNPTQHLGYKITEAPENIPDVVIDEFEEEYNEH